MSYNSETILSIQTHPGDSTETVVTGSAFKGDGYYSRSDGFHTVQYNVSGFIGTINIQATLATIPVAADWFTITSAVHTSTGTDSANSSGSFIKNFTGNYIWLRAVISNWTDGSVTSILLNH
jgi:hypothetical protein